MIATTKSGTNRLRQPVRLPARCARRPRLLRAGRERREAESGTPLQRLRRNSWWTHPPRQDILFRILRRIEAEDGHHANPHRADRAAARRQLSQTLDARGSLVVIYDPATTSGNVRAPFQGNVIPPDRLDPVALRIAALYPLPNRPPDNVTGANNFSANGTGKLVRDNYMIKVEHTIAQDQKLTGRYLYNSDNQFETSVYPEAAADTVTDALRHQNYFYIGYTRTFGAALINEVRYTYSDRINHTVSPGLGGGWPTTLGLTGVSDEAYPRFTIAGVAAQGAANHERRQFPIRQHQFVDTVWITPAGRHTLKTGAEVRPSFNYEVNRPSISGAFAFGTQPTALPGRSGTGHGMASLLLGFPNNVTIRETEVLD